MKKMDPLRTAAKRSKTPLGRKRIPAFLSMAQKCKVVRIKVKISTSIIY